MSPKKMVYYFGDGKADGDGKMKELLGGKGANLAEMSRLGIPVPAGFTITTEVCTHYYENTMKLPKELVAEVKKNISKTERAMGRKFGDSKNPLLLSVRSGARTSMPGMMDTVLNIGLCAETIPGLIAKSNERFVYDAYRRLIMMYSDVVMEKAQGIEPKEGQSIRLQLEHLMEALKKKKGYTLDTEMSVEDLKYLSEEFKKKVKQVLGKPFPDNAEAQLWGGIEAVFRSWNGKRAIEYRRIERIPDHWGTAVNVQSMVFGNMGDTSSTGVAFTRNPATGENEFYGEYLVNAQGEDVVAGIRTPAPVLKKREKKGEVSLERKDNKAFKQLMAIRNKLEKHFKDMLDIEFTIEDNKLWMLQCRVGKRNGPAAVRMAIDMLKEKLIDEKTALMRVKPDQLNELLLPMIDPKDEAKGTAIAVGLPAGPGGATGQITFTADDAAAWAKKGKKVLLVRAETSPEDVAGMRAAEAILTSKGGMTSHAALVARGWGKCCIVGCADLEIDSVKKTMKVGGKTYKEGDFLTLNGTAGKVYAGHLRTIDADLSKDKYYTELIKLANKYRQINVRANADNGPDATNARNLGAEGIGLCRTEHMFWGEQRIKAVRQMILADSPENRRKAIMKILPFQREDFIEIFTAMKGLPVTIRLMDPPLHEFMPQGDKEIKELAKEAGVSVNEIKHRIQQLHELNPMLGHRGCRLGVTYPEITEMQARAIIEAAVECAKKKIKVLPEIMVPLVGTYTELANQEGIIRRVADEVMKEKKSKIDYLVGTMIELPRAALTADEIAEYAEFFSFGTNDLTQTTYGFSRDDIGSFLPYYMENKILQDDPFQSLDQTGVGQLVGTGIEKGRSVRPSLKVGICGEHGGDPASVVFCHQVGMNYVSCSPFRVPIALFAAAQAAVTYPRKEDKTMAVATKKSTAKKATTAKKAAAKKPAAKKTTAKKPVAKKTAAKKPAAKKPVAKKATTAKKAAPKKAVAKKATKPAAKKTTAKKAAPKKAVAKKTAAKKPVAKKAPVKKAAAKTTAKKATARKATKPSARKTTTRKAAKK